MCRISRIVVSPGGHALLVGVGGSGKQSLSRLAAHICGYTTVTITISGSYSMNNFKEDLQKMYRRAGIKGEGLLFLFTDSQVVDERMLVYINDLLSSGEIPDLFAAVSGAARCGPLVWTCGTCAALLLFSDWTMAWHMIQNRCLAAMQTTHPSSCCGLAARCSASPSCVPM